MRDVEARIAEGIYRVLGDCFFLLAHPVDCSTHEECMAAENARRSPNVE